MTCSTLSKYNQGSPSWNLRKYFRCPSDDLERLLVDVEQLEALTDTYAGFLIALFGDIPIEDMEKKVRAQVAGEVLTT